MTKEKGEQKTMIMSMVFLIIILGFFIFAIIYWGFIRQMSFKGIINRIIDIFAQNTKLISLIGICFLLTGTLGFAMIFFLAKVSEDAIFSITFGILVVLVILIESGVFVKIENKIIVKIFSLGCKMEREIPNEYSPIMISYLQNFTIEPNKDIIAMILNLVSKEAIQINEKDGKIDIKKTGKLVKLRNDERYIYNIIDTQYDSDQVGKELLEMIEKKAKYELLITNKSNHILLILSIILAIALDLYFFVTTSEEILNHIALSVIMSICILALPLCIFEELKIDKIGYIYKGYTNKGLRLQRKIMGFKKFLKNYSMIEKRDVEEVYLWERYLAYAMSLNINVKYRNKLLEQIKNYQDINTQDNIYEKLFDEFKI